MKGRTVALFLVLLLLLLLVTSALRQGIPLTDLYLFRLESKLIYLILTAVAFGALFMFLLVSFFPPRRIEVTHRSASLVWQAGIASRIREAEIALQVGEWEKAGDLLQAITPSDSDYWYARKVAGDLAFAKQEWTKAESLYQESLKSAPEPRRVFVLFFLGNLFDVQGMFDHAQDLYKEVLRLDPFARQTALRLRSHAVKDQEWQQALAWQEHIERHFSKTLEDPEESMARIGIRYQLAKQQLQEGEPRTAQALLKYVFRLSDSFVPAYLLAGEIQEQLQNPSAAQRTWEKGFRYTQSPALLKRIGESFLSRNLPETAIEYLRNAVAGQMENLLLEYCLGELYLKLEMVQEAIHVFQNIDRKRPDWFLNRFQLAQLCQKTGQSEKAAALFRGILESAGLVSVLPWLCYNCKMTYEAYEGFCIECLNWNSINLNHEKAGDTDVQYGETTAFPL